MIWVETDLEVAIDRAKKRKRSVPEDYIRLIHKRTLSLKNQYREIFQYFKIIKNNDGELTNDVINQAFKSTYSFYTEPIKNKDGIRLYNAMKEKNVKYLTELHESVSNNLKKLVNTWYMLDMEKNAKLWILGKDFRKG